MPSIDIDRVITMTELQKLSLKKLRAMRLSEAPLVVLDRKRDERRFVILDHDSYTRLLAVGECAERPPPGLDNVDFIHHGILWDRRGMSNPEFAAILADPAGPEYRWAWGRALERLPARVVTRSVGLADLRRLISFVRMRPRVRAAWEGALEFWTEEARRRLA